MPFTIKTQRVIKMSGFSVSKQYRLNDTNWDLVDPSEMEQPPNWDVFEEEERKTEESMSEEVIVLDLLFFNQQKLKKRRISKKNKTQIEPAEKYGYPVFTGRKVFCTYH